MKEHSTHAGPIRRGYLTLPVNGLTRPIPVMEYNFAGRPSYKQYAKWTGLSNPECVKRLMELAVRCVGAGITMECVDCGNYKPDVCETIRTFDPGSVRP